MNRPPNIEKGYYVDDEHRILYVPILKAASMSAQAVIKPWHRELLHEEAVEVNKYSVTVAFVRHPWDRIVSALWGPLRSFEPFASRVQEHILGREPEYINSHVRPQSFILRDLDIDYFVRTDQIDADWKIVSDLYPHLKKEVPHRHRGQVRPVGWKDEYDWDLIYPLYAGDFALCQDWER